MYLKGTSLVNRPVKIYLMTINQGCGFWGTLVFVVHIPARIVYLSHEELRDRPIEV